MMRTKLFLRVLTLGWLPLILGGFGDAQGQGPAARADTWSFPDFSAHQVFQSGKAEMTMKVYRLGSSVRVVVGLR